MLEGIITKGIGGFYYIMTDKGLIESHARGLFREKDLTPMIGDRVLIRIREDEGKGYIEEIYPRKNQLKRPPVANITQAVIVFSISEPDINTWLLDRFLIMAKEQGLKTLIVINKIDLDEDKAKEIYKIYNKAGYEVLLLSTLKNIALEELKDYFKRETSVFYGPSGVGKSSILNFLNPKLDLEVGKVSKSTGRGRHTTRHVELMILDKNSYVLDTPGFSSLELKFIEDKINLRDYYKEMSEIGRDCKFQSCLHNKEPGCKVKKAVESGEIDKVRYKNYLRILEEIDNIKRY